MDNLIPIILAFALGGILKGATGAGAPILAVPVLAILYDVQFAVAVFLIPNIVSNLWQAWRFRDQHLSRKFSYRFAFAGCIGAVMGSYMLAALPSDTLMLFVAVGVFAYIGFRMLWRGWQLPLSRALVVVWPLGILAGILQGSTGVAAPISITFLNAMRMERLQFVATISLFFVTMAFVQIAVLTSLRLMTVDVLIAGCLAIIPLVGAMPIGAALIKRVSRQTFDKLIIGLLFVLAVKLVIDALS